MQLTVEVDANLPAFDTDEEKLQQILMNLLSNAAKFTERGTIRITAQPQGETLSIAIEDTGIGIPAEELERIFEEFYQVDHSHTRQPGGTGLGLSIAHHLTRLLGGNLSVRSIVGLGSTFTVTLPMPTNSSDQTD